MHIVILYINIIMKSQFSIHSVVCHNLYGSLIKMFNRTQIIDYIYYVSSSISDVLLKKLYQCHDS